MSLMDAQRLSFLLIDIDFKLRCIFQTVRAHAGQHVRMLPPCQTVGYAHGSVFVAQTATSISSKSKPVAVPSSTIAGRLKAKTIASLICE